VRGADPGPWLYTIAHRTFLDHVRRKRRSPERLHNTDDEVPAPAIGDVDDDRSAEVATEAVLNAVQELPEMQRLAVVTTKLEGRSMAQAAALLGTTEGALKVRAHRAYTALRATLSARIAV